MLTHIRSARDAVSNELESLASAGDAGMKRQLQEVELQLSLMEFEVSNMRVPPKNLRDHGIGRMIVDNWPLESGLYFQDWGDDLELKDVIVGARAEITPERLDRVLGELKDQVQTMRSRPAYDTFRVVPDRRPLKWRQPQKRRYSPGSSTASTRQ